MSAVIVWVECFTSTLARRPDPLIGFLNGTPFGDSDVLGMTLPLESPRSPVRVGLAAGRTGIARFGEEVKHHLMRRKAKSEHGGQVPVMWRREVAAWHQGGGVPCSDRLVAGARDAPEDVQWLRGDAKRSRLASQGVGDAGRLAAVSSHLACVPLERPRLA